MAVNQLHASGAERRQQLLCELQSAREPISGHELAEQLGVSRQIIVQDFAILRAAGHNILSTPRGYTLPAAPANVRAVIASRHDRAHTAQELRLLVDHGIRVVDVIVEHPVYGELRGPLMIASREDVRGFEERVLDAHVALLSELSDGLHLHTVEAPSEERLDKARQALRIAGFLVE